MIFCKTTSAVTQSKLAESLKGINVNNYFIPNLDQSMSDVSISRLNEIGRYIL